MEAAALIRQARSAAGLTQADLARRLGTSQPAIVKLDLRDERAADRRVAAVLTYLRATAPGQSPA